jgi:hypothetical protein
MFFIHPMNTAPPNPACKPAARCPRCSRETDEERLARYSSGLKRLAEIGLAFAEGLHQEFQVGTVEVQAQAAEPPGEAQSDSAAQPAAVPDRASRIELGRTFERVARSVRLAYLLEDKLIQDFAARAKEAAKDAAEQAVEKERLRRNATRRTVDRVVKEAIQAEAGDQSERNHLLGQLKLRLDQNDIYWDLATKPAEILIARLFRDLGLDPDWDRWQGEAWLNGDDYKVSDETPPVCPICGCTPASPAQRTEAPQEPGSADPPPSANPRAAGSGPPERSG